MPSTRGLSWLEILWRLAVAAGTLVLFFVLVARGFPPHFAVILVVILPRLFWLGEESEAVTNRSAPPAARWHPALPRATDRGHPLWDRWLDG